VIGDRNALTTHDLLVRGRGQGGGHQQRHHPDHPGHQHGETSLDLPHKGLLGAIGHAIHNTEDTRPDVRQN
jgi:hypothetical protein